MRNKWKVRLERVQLMIGTFQLFICAVMLQERGMPSCGIVILNETKQTNETQTNFECFVQCALSFAVRFCVCLSVGECNFCGNGLLKGSDQTTETSSFPEHLHVCQLICF